MGTTHAVVFDIGNVLIDPNDVVRAGNGDDHVWSYYTTSDTVLDCGPGSRDVLHLHNDIRGERIIGCEDIEIRYAS